MKTWMTIALVFAFQVGLTMGGCSNSETRTDQDLGEDSTTDSVAPVDVAEDSSPAEVLDDATLDLGPDRTDLPVPPADFGFDIRIPQKHKLQCDSPMGPQELDQLEIDWVCTFEYEELSAHIYAQATPTGCFAIMSAIPEFDTEAWISVDGVVTSLVDPFYDHGGNHNNDWIEFTWEGTRFKFYHSSFGTGWRKCQPPDCIQVLNDQGQINEDGCTMERTLPIVCVQVDEDGSYAELVDTFEPCNGDPNYQ